MKMLRPLDDRVLVCLDGELLYYDAGCLILRPEVEQGVRQSGIVVAVGPGRLLGARRQPIPLRFGDRVGLGRLAAAAAKLVTLNGWGECYLVRETDILGWL